MLSGRGIKILDEIKVELLKYNYGIGLKDSYSHHQHIVENVCNAKSTGLCWT